MTQDWRKEFDERFDFLDCAALNGEEIMSFISSLFADARKEGAEGAVEYIKKNAPLDDQMRNTVHYLVSISLLDDARRRDDSR